MSDTKEKVTLDGKELKSIVEEGLQISQKEWEQKREEDKNAFDEKVGNIVKDIESKGFASKDEVEKHVKEMQEQFDELATKSKRDVNQKGLGFKGAMAKALQENFDSIKDVNNIKGSKQIQLKDITYDGNFPGFEDWRQDTGDMITKDRDMFHLRDIIAVGSTSGDTIKYPREGDKTGTGPASWGRGADIATTDAKPSFEPNMDTYSAQVEWIAGIMRLPVEMLSDLPFLTSYLQNFAQAELLATEDNQILNGNGTSPQLPGLIPNATAYDGTYTDYTVNIEILVDAAYRQMAEANLTPTDLILNPVDVVSIILNKASGSGEYNLPGGTVGFVNGQLTVAGLNVRKSNKITKDRFLLGDFGAAQIFQRMAPQLRFFEQDQDNVIKNLVTARIEERLALAILKEKAFITGTFTAPA